MREPPPDFDEAELVDLVRTDWCDRVDRLEHLPVGFGAHHWAGYVEDVPQLFITVDQLLPRHPGTELEDAYATATHLARIGLEFVVGNLPRAGGRFTAPLGERAVSVTAWSDGTAGDGPLETEPEVMETAELLGRLHAVEPLPRTPRWRTLVGPSFADDLGALAARPWRTGPYGERARDAVVDQLAMVTTWTARYHHLADLALARRDHWVTTHGEPHTANHLVTPEGRLIVDWESVKVAPRERDLRPLVESGLPWASTHGGDQPDTRMLEMFDLEWRLDEVSQYAAWFAAEHTGSASDEVALHGLLEELTRPGFSADRST